MKSSKEKQQEQFSEWEGIRAKGRTNYVIKKWVLIYGIMLPVFTFFPVSIFSLIFGVSLKDWAFFFPFFMPFFILISVLCGLGSWKSREERYRWWIKTEKEGYEILPGTRAVFKKKALLALGIYSMPIFFLNILFFFGSIFLGTIFFRGSHFIVLMFVLFVSIFIISTLLVIITMLYVKNPICNHGILNNPDRSSWHPDAKGINWLTALKILRGHRFICQYCANVYYLEKRNNRTEIVKT